MKGLYLVVSAKGVCMQDGFESYDEAVKWKDSAYMGYYSDCSIRPNPHLNSSFSFVLRVHCGNGQIENIWSGDDMSEAIRLEDIAIKLWGRDNVWIADAVTEISVG